MKKDTITRFDIAICQSERHQYKFAVISPLDSQDSHADTDMKIRAYINFHLAIVPNLPVILFEIETSIEIGSPLYNHIDGSKIYHIPKQIYPHIEEAVKETNFIVNHQLLNTVINANKLYKSIFECLDEMWNEGVLVLGIYRKKNETEETEV